MAYFLACRLASYGAYQERAWTHLPELGIRHLEVHLPPADQRDELHRRLAKHGLKISSMQISCDVGRDDIAEQVAPQLKVCREFDASLALLPLKPGPYPHEETCDKLRLVGEVAQAAGVIVMLETHPDIAGNGRQATRTMQAIDHPFVRLNFDPANMYFYNEQPDMLSDLEACLPYLAGVHLKDTPGGYRQYHFATLGGGVVDFPEMFRRLDAHDYTGPCTIEIQGIEGQPFTEDQQLQCVADSAAYLENLLNNEHT